MTGASDIAFQDSSIYTSTWEHQVIFMDKLEEVAWEIFGSSNSVVTEPFLWILKNLGVFKYIALLSDHIAIHYVIYEIQHTLVTL